MDLSLNQNVTEHDTVPEKLFVQKKIAFSYEKQACILSKTSYQYSTEQWKHFAVTLHFSACSHWYLTEQLYVFSS